MITCSPLNWDAWAHHPYHDPTHNKFVWQGEDSVNVQRKVVNHLKQTRNRAAVSSVYEMARLIADKCASLFGGHDLDIDLRFFDFFEQTVARVVSVLLLSTDA